MMTFRLCRILQAVSERKLTLRGRKEGRKERRKEGKMPVFVDGDDPSAQWEL